MGKNNKTAKIILFGDERLRTPCKKVGAFHKGLHSKIDMIANTLRQHGGGAALAAPQVALLKQIVVINYLNEYYELINPQTVDASGETVDYEGCLSLPDFAGPVKRYRKITVQYQDRNGELHTVETKDRMARCFQHEMDHLNGILYIDRMSDEFVYNDVTGEKLSVKYLQDLTRPGLNAI